MLYGEKLKEILSKTGVDVSTLPNSLYSTILQAISDNIDNNTGGGSGGGSSVSVSVEGTKLIIDGGTVEGTKIIM